MNYIHHPYAYTGHPTVPMDQPIAFDPAMTHPSMIHPIEGGYMYPQQPPPFDMMDFYHQPIMDYEEYAENLSRPRLTKEQVETLEAQFQAHPKPSSNVKRQLAAQTNLSLPRVANWFQNRRAKAKQQRRQEEFERMQKAKAEAEEAARSKSESTDHSSDSKENTRTPTGEADKALTPKQEETNEKIASSESVSPTTTTTTSAFSSIKGNSKRNSHSGGNGQSAFDAMLEWEAPRDPSVAWSHGSQEAYGSQRQEYPQGEDWMGQVPASSESLPSHHRASHNTGSSYSTMQYPLQTEASLPRRTSSDELANHLEGIDKASWKETGKELDLAARRKRPRPAAIGTSKSSSMLSAAASMSPNTTRMPSYGNAHGVRQSKSAQSLNSRYAGVRKASAAQRSPLNFSTFSEAGGKADMSSMLHPITTNALAPPTPLTPEDMHHLLPTSPSDSYCLSAHPSTQVFPSTQPMQINVASPPATPLTVDMMSSYPYQNTAPPMSAPAHYTSFPEYAPCEAAPLTAPARSWGETPSISSPDQSYHPGSCQVPQPADISPIAYNPAIDASGQTMKHEGTPEMSPSMGTLGSDGKFMIQEFPDQQEAHRFVAQQLPPQPPKHYTFTNNQTPNDF